MNWSSAICAVEELARLGVEVVELALEDRDHVPGDVLVDLGVLERARPALALLRLGQVLVELCRVGRSLGLRGRGRRLHAQAVLQNPDWD